MCLLLDIAHFLFCHNLNTLSISNAMDLSVLPINAIVTRVMVHKSNKLITHIGILPDLQKLRDHATFACCISGSWISRIKVAEGITGYIILIRWAITLES